MGQNRSYVMNGATQRYHYLRICSSQSVQIPCDRTRGNKENSVSQVFTSQQSALAQSFLANIENTSLSKTCWAVLLQDPIILRAAMYRQAYTLLFTFGHRLTRGLISADGDKRDLSWRGFDTLFIQERKVDIPDNIENRMGFKRRTV
jgi:hypothetical protein